MRLALLCLALASTASARDFDVRQFGAAGDFAANDTAAIQKAIDACHHAGGGTVMVPPGRYLAGALRMRSNVNLHLEFGAALYASTRKEDYQTAVSSTFGVLLFADGAENIAVTGGGVLHGQGEADFGHRWGVPDDGRFRTGIIYFRKTRNVILRDFTILYSDCWTLQVQDSDGVTIDGIRIRNNLRRLNSDGIDITSSRNVHISNCDIVAGDDAIDPKSHGGVPVENVVVTNCTLRSATTGLKIGTGTAADFRNIHFSNITINAPSGIGFYMKDGGTAENITFSNITIHTPPKTVRDIVPIFFDIERRHAKSPLSHIRDISLRDVFITSGSGVLIQGMPESRIENLTLDSLTFRVAESPDSYEKRSKPTGGQRSTSDERDTKFIQMPFYIALAYVDGVRLRNITIEHPAAARRAYRRGAVTIHEARSVLVDGLRATAAEGDGAPAVLRFGNVANAYVVNSGGLRAEEHTQ